MWIREPVSACFSTACIVLLLAVVLPNGAGAEDELSQLDTAHSGEAIEFWYGEKQRFGFPGLAQPFINIPGRVSGVAKTASLSYSLNNTPGQVVNVGPDLRRLAAPGDFNIEIPSDGLRPGSNRITVTRVLENNRSDIRNIELIYERQVPWPLPYRVEWSQVEDIQAAVQIVDGLWLLNDSGIRIAPGYVGYDRTIALGDSSWSSYEILLSFTVNGVDSSAYESPESVSPGFGVILHWNGHTDTPVDCGQPRCGWFPVGAINWYSFPENKPGGFNVNTRPMSDLSVSFPYELQTGANYFLRCRVESLPFVRRYALKVWKAGDPEPEQWSLQQDEGRKNPASGGILLVAHHVDLTFGAIEVTKLDPEKSGLIKNYLVFIPEILTGIAGFFFLCIWIRKGKARSKSAAVSLSLLAIVCTIFTEPMLPKLLQNYSLNEKMSAALYIGHDFISVLLLFVVWGCILQGLFGQPARGAIE